MFLLNTPPLAVFPKQWTPFGCNAPCRGPSSIPPPAPEANIPVAAAAEGAIDSPQSDESSLTVNLDYERIMQWNRTGEKSNPALFTRHPREKAALIVPVQFKDLKEEEASDFAALALDSDSDDSVDRGIEEAIQEYLRDRAAPSSCTPAAKSPNITENYRDKVISPPARKSPVKMVTSPPKLCNSFTVESRTRCLSPDSGESDDSFEQSIQEEIEQFLIEKKLQNNASESNAAKKAANSHLTVKQKPVKAAEKSVPKQAIKGPTMKTASESFALLPITYKPKAESCKGTVRLKPVFSPGNLNVSRQPAAAPCIEISDSSSDDGIEEAIQLYQLEKSRLEGSLGSNSRTSPEKDGKSTANATLDVSNCQVKKSAESPVRTDHRKRKRPSVKAAASQDFTNKRTLHSGDDRSHECKPEVAATELMCAEAILDISKAILPSQPEHCFTASQDKPASPCSSDSSVDSDDSIEQEIRTFLARKAEAEGLGATSTKQPPKEHRPEPPKLPSLSNSKAAGTSKGKLKHDKVLLGDSLEKTVESLNVANSPVNSALPFSPAKPSPGDSSKHYHQAEDPKHHVIQTMESLESSPGISRGKRKMYMKKRSNCSGDKSSSLDSDEDLDSAIKDLLRSKRKYKKRPKDGRPPCKKKVRFGETTTRLLETVGGTEPKSCLVISNDPKENHFKASKTILRLKEDKKAPMGNTDLSPVSKPMECKPPCASEKTSSVLSDTQDSSSVDSDDSIEQEIRKFLAERARESAELSGAQRTTAPVITASVSKTETTLAHMKEPACTGSSPASAKKDLQASTGSSPASVKKDPPVCTGSSPASVKKDLPASTGSSPASVKKDPPAITVSSPASIKDPAACTGSPASLRKYPIAGTVSSPASIKDPSACIVSSSPASVKKHLPACTGSSPAYIKDPAACTGSSLASVKDPSACIVVSPASIKKDPPACTVSSSPASVKKYLPACTGSSLASVKKFPPACTLSSSLASVKKFPPACIVSSSPASVKKFPPACIVRSAAFKKEPGVLSSSVTETILQKVREKDRSTAAQPAIIKCMYGFKDSMSPVARLQHPIAKAPVHSVLVKRDCIVDPNRIARPTETTLAAAPDRAIKTGADLSHGKIPVSGYFAGPDRAVGKTSVNRSQGKMPVSGYFAAPDGVVKTGVNVSQEKIPVSGNFVAGLKYISGTEQQLLLNVGQTGTSRLAAAADFYNPGGTVTQLVTCKKPLILEQPKVVQTPAFSLGAPVGRPALYVVTTKVVQEAPASLCLPINTAAYDAGLNLMSIQYCPSQVASRPSACTAPFSFQQTRNNEAMVITPGKAGEIPKLITKARPSEATSVLLDGERKCANVTESAAEDVDTGASMLQREEV